MRLSKVKHVAALGLAAGCLLVSTVTFKLSGSEANLQNVQGLLSSYASLVRVARPETASGLQWSAAAPGEHALAPVVRWAHEELEKVRAIDDYSCTLIKRERVQGRLIGPQYLAVKVRHRPFSVYLRYLDPPALRNEEVIYVEGRNDGKLQAHVPGTGRILGTVSLRPTCRLAMRGNRYPITEVGMLRLIERLIKVGEDDMRQGVCELAIDGGVAIDGQLCSCINVRQPVDRQTSPYYIAKVYVDERRMLPIRFEAYGFPPHGEPAPLVEEYTYVDLKLNNGFTDADFDVKNPAYAFEH
jgi:uncharacterized protein DUF1571